MNTTLLVIIGVIIISWLIAWCDEIFRNDCIEDIPDIYSAFYTMYKVIYIDKDYDLAIVTGNSMDYVWILSRKPVISQSELAMCLEMLKKWGYAVKLLQYPTGEIESLMTAEKTN